MKARARSAYLLTGIGSAEGVGSRRPQDGVARRTRHKYVRATPLRAVSPLWYPRPSSSCFAATPGPSPCPQTLRNPRERSVADVREPTSLAACNVSDRSQLNGLCQNEALGAWSVRSVVGLHAFMRFAPGTAGLCQGPPPDRCRGGLLFVGVTRGGDANSLKLSSFDGVVWCWELFLCT